MAMTQAEKDRVYTTTFDTFVRTRDIDEDDATWSEEDWAAWRERVEWMRSMGALEVAS